MYLEPGDVVDAVVSKLQQNIDNYSYGNKIILTVQEIADLPEGDETGLNPPWLGVFYSLDDDGDILEDGSPDAVPVTIGILSSSTPGYQNEAAALREAMSYSKQIINDVIGEYIIDVGGEEKLIVLRCRNQPREIIQADAELSLVVTRFFYQDYFED